MLILCDVDPDINQNKHPQNLWCLKDTTDTLPEPLINRQAVGEWNRCKVSKSHATESGISLENMAYNVLPYPILSDNKNAVCFGIL